MYVHAFGLEAEPFAPTPDPAFLYLTEQHRDALAALEYGLRERRGFVTLIGDVGTGKTTILYTLLESLGATIDCAYLTHTTLDYDELLHAALVDLGVTEPGNTKGELVATLNRFLHKQADNGRITALVVDEAQNLSLPTLEELRLLTDYETFQHKLLQIVLVGQTELDERLAEPQMRQLRDRIAVRSRLVPLEPGEVRGYVDHRLRIVGGSVDSVFSRGAVTAIARWSQGNPRRINTLCHNALLAAYARGERRVTRRILHIAMDELQADDPRSALSRWRAAAARSVHDALPRLRRRSVAPARRPALRRGLLRFAVVVGLAVVLIGVFRLSQNDPAALEPVERGERAVAAAGASPATSFVSQTWAGAARVLDALIPKGSYLEWHRRARGYRE